MSRARVVGWVAFLSVLLLDATAAFSRAGGGGGYSSGGGSSSYSPSSSSGSLGRGGGDFTLFDGVVLLLTIGVAVVFTRRAQRRMAQREREQQERARAWLKAIEARDPDFDFEAFEGRITDAFMKIQEAWSNQDLRRVRGFMSDGLHERFSIQLREQESLGYRNRVSDVRIHALRLAAVRALTDFDVISVRITASATDVRLDAATGREIEGTRRAEGFTEIWSFLRGHGAGTRGRPGLLEGQCPNCSAPVDPERIWACASCGSELEGAPPDWVLTEITQSSEWSAAAPSEPAWWKAAILRDPGLTFEQLEDRASVLFWRLMDADRRGSMAELAHLCRPLFRDRQIQRLSAARGREEATYVGDCAVGSVQLRGIVPGKKWDLALIEIRWSGGVFERRRGGGAVETGARVMRRSLLVMARRSGVQSDVGRCIVSAHCASCGAPDEGTIEGCCGFCGDAMDDGRDWLIDRFLEMGGGEASLLLAEVGRGRDDEGRDAAEAPVAIDPGRTVGPGGEELFAWCLRVAYSDQKIDRRELQGLDRLASRLGIRPERARRLRQAAQFGRLEVEMPGDAALARDWIVALAAMARVDGRIDPREKAVVETLAGRLGIGVPL